MQDPAWARRVLVRANLLDPDDPAEMTLLSGGVSSDVVRVDVPASDTGFIVKRPGEWFRVGDAWRVPKRRARIEHEAARLFAAHLPGQVAPVLHFVDDPEAPVIVYEAAPAEWAPWKVELLAGQTRLEVARRAGNLLAKVHALSDQIPRDMLRDDALFRAQRIEPYFQMAAHRLPRAAPMLAALSEQFFEYDDLVHGDFTPKNLLTAPQGDGLWLIDHEVVTRGDAAFDLASLCNHLAIKSPHRPTLAPRYLECAQAATTAYMEADVGPRPDPALLFQRSLHWLPALFLARMIGKSPAEYLDPGAKTRGVQCFMQWFDAPPTGLPAFWATIPSD